MNTPDDNVIPGFRKMSKQRIMDKARAHINITRKASMNQSRNCVYAGSGCNAAPLVNPSKRAVFDKIGPWSELVEKGKVPGNNAEFISLIQDAHDSAASASPSGFIDNYNENMKFVAKKYKLNYTPIK